MSQELFSSDEHEKNKDTNYSPPRKLTAWEKRMRDEHGYTIIDFTHEEIMDHLIDVFIRDREHLTMLAAADDTKRHELSIILDYENIGDKSTIFGGLVHYDKKKRRFTHISYADKRGWAVLFSIETKVAFFAYDFCKQLQKMFPIYSRGYSIKSLTKRLLNN